MPELSLRQETNTPIRVFPLRGEPNNERYVTLGKEAFHGNNKDSVFLVRESNRSQKHDQGEALFHLRPLRASSLHSKGKGGSQAKGMDGGQRGAVQEAIRGDAS